MHANSKEKALRKSANHKLKEIGAHLWMQQKKAVS